MKSIFVAGLLAAAALTPVAASAQTALTTTTYNEDFNSLARTGTTGTALPAGFAFVETGSSADASYGISQLTSNLNTGNAYSFGVASTAADRAFGSIGSGSMTSIMYGFLFTNGLSGAISSFDISYFGEQWRRGTSTDDGLTFQYSTNATSLTNGTWTSVSALNFAPPLNPGNEGPTNGNLGSFRTNLTGTISGLNIAQGGNFAFRWTDINSGGNDFGLAIDDVQIISTLQANAVPEPATWLTMILGFGGVAGALRRRQPARRVRYA